MGWPLPVLRQIGELGAVVGEHGVDAMRNRFEESRGRSHICGLPLLNAQTHM